MQPESSSLLQKLETLKPYDHLCLIYETPEQWKQAAIPFISIGLTRGEKCLYIVDEHYADEIRTHLKEEGVDVGYVEETGQLAILDESVVYTKEESFDPDRIIAFLIRETEKAVSEGYSALRVTGEMTWVLKGHPGAEKLLEYEANLNRELFSKYPCIAICQYNRWKFEPEIIRGIMITHPLLIYNNNVYRNFHYIPSDEYLGRNRAERELQHWLNSVKREEERKVSLEATADYLNRIINGMLDPLLVIDKDYKVLDVNQCFVETYNSSREKVIGKHCFEVTHGLDSPCSGKNHICPLQLVLHDGMPARVEHLHKDRFDKDLVFEIHALPMLNPDGSIRAIVEVQRDITERKQAKEALWYSEERFRVAQEMSPDGFTILHPLRNNKGEIVDFTWVYENQAIASINRTDPEEVIGKRLLDLFPSHKGSALLETYNDVANTKKPKVIEEVFVGEIISKPTWLRLVIVPMGEDIAILTQNITERKQVEDKIKRQSDFIKTTTDNLPLGLAINTISDGRFQYMNSRFEEIYDITFQEVADVDAFWEKAYPEPEYREQIKKRVMDDIYSGDASRMQWDGVPITNRSGRNHIISAVNIPIHEQDIMISTVQDITDKANAEQALKESEERFRTMVNSMEEVIFTLDIEMRHTGVYGSWVERMGLSPEYFLGKTSREIFGEEQAIVHEQANRQALAGEFVIYDWHIEQPESIVYFQTSLSPIRDDEGKLTGLVGIGRNITSLKLAEQTLKKSEDKYKVLFSQSMEAIYLHGLDGQIVEVNEVASEQSGYSLEELTNMSIFNLHPEDPDSVNVPKDEILKQWKNWQSGQRHLIDAHHQRKDGSIYPVAISAGKVMYGDQIRILAVVRDMTTYKEQEENLRQAQDYTQSIIHLIPDVVIRLSKDGQYLDVIAGSQDKLIRPAEELIGGNIKDFLQQETGSRAIEAIRLCIESNSLQQFEYELQVPQGNRWFEARIIPSENDEALALIRDITDLKQAEKEAHELRTKAEISSRLASVGEMATGIAHEINNPLTSVLGFSELLSQEDLPPEVNDHVRYITEGSQRVKEIVKRLLTFARQTQGVQISVNIHELIDTTLELRNYVHMTSNITVIKKYDASLPWVTVDPGQLQQVFMNLIVNAEYAMKKARDGGVLTITTTREGERVRISIQDDGVGISEETLSRLFSPFFTTKDPGEGTGLGLSLSRSIILEHRGELEVQSKLGEGATFIIKLPINKNEQSNGSEQANKLGMNKQETVGGNILVVDDEPSVRALIKTTLSSRGYIVTEVKNADIALEKIKGQSFDVILVDFRMPGMSGKELYEQIASNHPEMASGVVFISGDTSDAGTRGYFKNKQLRYITKPFNREELLQVVHDVMASRK